MGQGNLFQLLEEGREILEIIGVYPNNKKFKKKKAEKFFYKSVV